RRTNAASRRRDRTAVAGQGYTRLSDARYRSAPSARLAPRCLRKQVPGRRRELPSSPGLLRESAQRQPLWIFEMALARHEIYFEPDAIGILEQDRVVTRCPRTFARWTNNLD